MPHQRHVIATPAPDRTSQPVGEKAPEKEKSQPSEDETGIPAPMPGIIIRYEVKEGDSVKTGDTVVVLEAMKMAIDLPATADGVIKKLNFRGGDYVARDDILAVIGS
jgi:biotin carboxyl carrier protein